jgi:NAD+ kinase
MIKVALIESSHAESVGDLLRTHGFEVAIEGFELVVTNGGDGTILRAEHLYPGVPKLVLRGSPICKMCLKASNEEVLTAVAAGKYKLKEHLKLEVEAKGERLMGLNDIVIRNREPRHALRYHFWKDGERVGNEIIGDGVVVATPFGSRGYFRSITDAIFDVGIGVAFNNSTEQTDHLVVGENSELKVELNRCEAFVYADNQEKWINLEPSDTAIIRKSDQIARTVEI